MFLKKIRIQYINSLFFFPSFDCWLTFYYSDNKADIWYTEVGLFNMVPSDIMAWAQNGKYLLLSCGLDVTIF